MTQPSVLFVGAGKISTLLGLQLVTQGWHVTALRRNIHDLPSSFDHFRADITLANTLNSLADKCFDYIVFTLAPSEHTEDAYRSTYLDGTRNVLNVLTRNALAAKAKHLFFASSTSIYGNDNGEWIDEDALIPSTRFNGKVMHQTEQLILNANIPATNIRFGGIYGGTRTSLVREVSTGSASPRDHTWSNRIHEQDAVNVLQHLLTHAQQNQTLPTCLNAVDNEPAPLFTVKNWLAEALNVPFRWTPLKDEHITGRRCQNNRLKELGFQFTYPDYKLGYTALLNRETESKDD